MKRADIILALIWTGLILCAVVTTLAINDFNRAEAQRLERVYTDGMATGATMCGGGR